MKKIGITAVCIAALLHSTTYAQSSVDNAAEAAGGAVRKILSGFKKGFSTEGEERALLQAELSDALKKEDIALNSVKRSGFEDVLFSEGITCYLVGQKDFNGRLVARAYNEAGVELGHSATSVSLAAGQGEKVVFEYPRSLDVNLVSNYVIDILPSNMEIVVDDSIESKTGLRLSQIEEPAGNYSQTLKAYAVATKSVSGRLIAIAYSADGQEIDRSQVSVRMSPEESRDLRFSFSSKTRQAKRITIEYLAGAGLAIEAGDSLQALGLDMARAQDSGIEGSQVRIVSYIIANKPFRGTIIAKGLDAEGVEIGRGTADVDLKIDDARELVLDFPLHMSAQDVVRFVVEARVDEEATVQ